MRTPALLAGALAGVLATGALPAFARPAFLRIARQQLRLDQPATGPPKPGAGPLQPAPTPLASAGCQLCHVKPEGGAPWNPFGLAVGRQRALKLALPDALYAALKLRADADNDGYGDALEVFAGTLPGDARSVPAEAPAALERRFEAAGGLSQYAPRTSP